MRYEILGPLHVIGFGGAVAERPPPRSGAVAGGR
jgi:hypothetical protein